MERRTASINPIASSATPVAFAPSARSTRTPFRSRSGKGRLSTPVPLRETAFRLSATSITRGLTGSMPASQPAQPGSSSISSASPGSLPGVEKTSSWPASVRMESSRGGSWVSERGVMRMRAMVQLFAASMAMRDISSKAGPDVGMSMWKTSAMTCVQPWMK